MDENSAKQELNNRKTLLPPCKKSCRLKCFEKLKEEDRAITFNYYNKLQFGEKRLFLHKYLSKNCIKYRKVDAASNRRYSVSYHLPRHCSLGLSSYKSEEDGTVNSPDEAVTVCKTMFLHSLGHKTDFIITTFLKDNADDLPYLKDNRGKKRAADMKELAIANYNEIKKHIELYHPQVSHYNLAHALYKKYLPNDLNVRIMYNHFKETCKQVTYETYRKVVHKEKIGFTTSSSSLDVCTVCSLFKYHYKVHEGRANETSTPYDDLGIHIKSCTTTEEQYRNDGLKQWRSEYEVYAVDMEEALILPKINVKAAFFTSRLVVFHQTFANMQKNGENKSILWHEGITGRNSSDVVSAYYECLLRLQNKTKHVIFWAENCTAQNKNWTLITSCIIFVNQDWGPQTITFKYFEPGHISTKAQEMYTQITANWKKAAEIVDFEDLQKLIESLHKCNTVISLQTNDFLLFQNGCSSTVPKLSDIRTVQFRKGSNKMFYKSDLEQEEFRELSVLRKNFILSLPDKLPSCRGVNSKKKDMILKELLPYMAPRKQIFWQNLSTSESDDLGKCCAEV